MKKYLVSYVLILQILMLTLGVGMLSFHRDYASVVSSEQVAASEMTAESAAELKPTAPQDLAELQKASDAQLDEWTKLQKFDGRDYKYVTSQKAQGSYPVCWAFAAAGLAEVSVLREGIAAHGETNKTLDFDDLHVAWASRNMNKSSNPLMLMKDDVPSGAIDWNEGDSLYNALYSMTDGYSPISQQADGQFRTNTESEYIAEQVIRIDPSKEAIKKAILKYGGVGFSYRPRGGVTGYFYDPNPGTTHVSVIVGWDDNIEKSKFINGSKHPNENGAWIVKNSWGEKLGADQVDDIYAYYLSYESHIGYRFAVDMALKKDYPNIYQYDGCAVDSNSSVSDIDANAAIFEAKLSDPTKEEYLKAIQVGFNAQNVDLQIEIYKLTAVNLANVNDERNVPTNGQIIYNDSVKFEKDGFFIIPLKNEILLEQGEYFSIVLYDKNKKNLKVICGVDINSVNDMTYYRQGNVWRNYKYSTSYIYANEPDITNTARIRAITITRNRKENADAKDLKYARIELENRLLLYKKGMTQKPDPTVYMGDTVLTEGQDYNVEIKGNNITPGTVEISINGYGEYTGTRTTMFEITKPYRPANLPKKEIKVYRNTVRLHDIDLPDGWFWIEEDQILEDGKHNFNIKYEGEDSAYFINLYYDVTVNKLNEDPPARISIIGAETVINDYTYTGSPIIPDVKVILDGKDLKNGTHYKLECTNNTNAGTADVTISGIGLYKDQISTTFTIDKAEYPTNRPTSTMTISKRIERLSQINLPSGWSWQNLNQVVTDNFEATAVYNGSDKNNYNHISISITIIRSEKVDISTINVTYTNGTFVYNNGSPIQPTVIATDGEYSLVQNTDFSVEYQNNTDAGQGTIIVTGIGEYYTGTKTLTFTIAKANRTDFAVNIDGWIYGQNAKTPTSSSIGEEVTYEYSPTPNENYSTDVPTDAGTYYVRATMQESQNYNEAVAYASFTISKATGTMSATIEDWTFGESLIAPNITSSTNTANPVITYRKLNSDTFTSTEPTDAGDYEMKIVLPESKNYTSCEQILTFKILKAEKPKSIPSSINVSSSAKTLKEVNLPDGWKWEEPNLDITENMTKAVIVRIDESNYIQSRFEIELAFVTDSERPAGSYILWWSLGIIGGIIGGVAVATVVIWLVGRKKRRQN